MQRPDEKKRRLITEAAARMFATRPFHKVKLDDVAAAAKVGKGTLYVYFSSKEELYFSLIYDGFARLVDQLKESLGKGELSAGQTLRTIVRELTRFAFGHPHFFELVRTAGAVLNKGKWPAKRRELSDLIEGTLRRGNAAGEFDDPHPELTALMVPGLLRSVMIFGPKGLDESAVAGHIVRLVERGVGGRRQKEEGRRKNPKSQISNLRSGISDFKSNGGSKLLAAGGRR
jgi:AcrR family transcriptional regulator